MYSGKVPRRYSTTSSESMYLLVFLSLPAIYPFTRGKSFGSAKETPPLPGLLRGMMIKGEGRGGAFPFLRSFSSPCLAVSALPRKEFEGTKLRERQEEECAEGQGLFRTLGAALLLPLMRPGARA